MDLTFAPLMARAGDEPDAMYGLVGEIGADFAGQADLSLYAAAGGAFHDGSKLTAHDAAFSLTTLKAKGHPLILVADARHGEGGSARRRDAGRHLRRKARARRAALCREPADLLEGLLRDAAVRRIDARYPARIGAVQGRQVRGQSLHRIRAGQGLVGRRSAGLPRQLQFRHRALRILPRPRCRVRRLHRQELSVPRGIHRADLGDALRFPGRQGRPRQARDPAGRNAVRRAGLVHQHPPRQVQGSARARGADPRLRFRMDQQDHHVRRLCAHPFAVPEFRHDGERAAVAGRTQAARAVSRPGAGRGVRRAVRAAGVRRLGAGPRRCCARRRNCCRTPGLPIKDGKRLLPNGEVFKIEFLHRRAVVPAAPRALSSRISARSGSRPACGWSMPCNTAPGWKISIST